MTGKILAVMKLRSSAFSFSDLSVFLKYLVQRAEKFNIPNTKCAQPILSPSQRLVGCMKSRGNPLSPDSRLLGEPCQNSIDLSGAVSHIV
jgi:hypothetical protein